jgi:photosystem II stability/assembly factor-like uncharacterized protein
MKNPSRCRLVFTVLALLSPAADGAWTKVYNEIFESVFAIDDRILIASSYAALFRSVDGGQTWSRLAVEEKEGFFKKDSIVFAWEPGSGIWRSYDSGASWKSLYTYQGNAYVKSLCAIGNRLLAGTANGIYYSDNNGMKWTNTRSGLTDDSVTYVFAFGSTVLAKTLHGSFRSPDSGVSWSATSGPDYTSLASSEGVLYAATPTNGLNRSIDSGKTWEAVFVGADFKRLEFLAVYDKYVFFGNNYGLFLIPGKGSQWIDIGSGSHKHQDGCITIAGNHIYCGFWLPNLYEEYRRPVLELIDIMVRGPEIDSTLWVQTNGPCGGNVSSIVWNDTALFAATSGEGVYRSLNGGLNWTRVRSSGKCLAVNGGAVFAAHDSIVRTVDNGKSWITVYTSGIYEVSCVATIGNLLFAGGWQTGVFSSGNNGVAWEERRTGLESYTVLSFGAAGGTVLVGASNGLYTFREGYYYAPEAYEPPKWVCSALQGSSIHGIAGSGATQYAATSRGLLASNDSGKTWRAVNDSTLSKGGVSSVVLGENALFAGRGDVFRSTDNAGSWVRVLSGSVSGGVNCITAGRGVVLAGCSGGVYRSADGGETWSRLTAGITNSRVSCLARAGGRLFAGTRNAGIHRLADGGTAWTETGAGLPTMRVAALSAVGDVLYAATEDRGVYRSDNGGELWTAANAGLADTAMTCLEQVGGSLFAGAAGGGLSVLAASGSSWAGANLSAAVTCLAAGGGMLFAGTKDGVYVTSDKGAAWDRCASMAGAVRALTRTAGGGLVASTDSGVYYSFTAGSQGTNTTVGSADVKVNALSSVGNALFAGATTGSTSSTIRSRMFRSGDGGVTWVAVDSGLPPEQWTVTSFSCDGTSLFAGTDGRGVWRRPMLQITGIGAPLPRPEASKTPSLRMAPPLRRRGAVAVGFMLTGNERVCVRVFDLSGRVVAKLADASFEPGRHTVRWDTRNASAGCYLVRLQSRTTDCAQRLFIGK